MRLSIYKLFFSLLLISCGNSEKSSSVKINTEKYNYKLKAEKKISVSIDANTYPIFFRSQYLPKSNDLIIANSRENLIRLNLNKNQITENIKFSKEGEHDVKGAGYDFYYHNKDSIFLMGQKSKIFYLTDNLGKIKKSVKFENIDKNIDNYGEPMLGMGNTSGVYRNSSLYVLTYPVVAEKMIKSEDNPTFIAYNLKTDSVKESSLSYSYSVNYDELQHPSFIMPLMTKANNGSLILMFKTDSHFLIEKGDEFTKIPFESDYVEEYSKMEKMEDIPLFEIENSNNERLLTNQKTGNHYLFLSHGTDYINEDTGNLNSLYSKPFSVLIFDSNYKKLLERKFPGNTYNLNSSFISNDYLYLSLNNPENDLFNENQFQFELFKLKNV